VFQILIYGAVLKYLFMVKCTRYKYILRYYIRQWHALGNGLYVVCYSFLK